MKKQKFTGKLNLNKETISRLQDEEANRIIGGQTSAICTVTTCPKPPTTNNCTPITEPYCCSYPYECPIG